MLLSYFGLAIPQGALDLAGYSGNPEVTRLPPATPTQEIIIDAPIYKTFTPHTNYKINLRANCSRTAQFIEVITKPIAIDTTSIFKDTSGYTWARTSTGECIAIAFNNSTYGVIQ